METLEQINELHKEGKTVKEIVKILEISTRKYYDTVNPGKKGSGKEDKKKSTNNKSTPKKTLTTNEIPQLQAPAATRISFEPEELSGIINSFITQSKVHFTSLEQYLDWRSGILPFLALEPTEHRHMLYNLPFIMQLSQGRPETKAVCELALKNLLDYEFTRRLKELENIRHPH